VLHVSHGVGVAVGTPLNLRYNSEPCTAVYCWLADACGIGAGSPAERAARFVDTVVDLLRDVGLPARVDVPGGANDELVEKLVRNAQESTPVPITLNPRKVDDAALAQMFREILS
jgi:alcohol dehydrogenase class IV